jgi:predicted ATPase
MRLLSSKYYNFKKLRNIDLNYDYPRTILIGTNNSGKTTLLEGIQLAIENPPIQKDNINYLSKKHSVSKCYIELIFLIEQKDILSLLPVTKSQDFLKRFLGRKLKIIWSFDKNFEKSEVSYNVLDMTADLDDTKINEVISEITREIRSNFIYIKSDRKIPLSETFVPFDRFRDKPDKDQDIRHYFLYLFKKKKKQFNELNEDLQRIFGLEIKSELDYDSGRVRLSITENGEEFDISEIGSGLKYLLLLFVRIRHSNDGLLMLDEPDLSMHEGMLKSFLDFLRDEFKGQIIMCSHNPIFIESFSEDETKYVYSHNNLSTGITQLGDKRLNNLLNDLGIVLNNYSKTKLINYEVIVLIEGNDINIIQRLIEKADLQDSLPKNLRFLPVGGSTQRINNLDILDGINFSNFPFLLVRDSDEADTDHTTRLKAKLGKRVYFWKKSEIENYVLDYDSLLKTMTNKLEKKKSEDKVNVVVQKQLDNLTLDTIKRKVSEFSKDCKIEIISKRVFNKYKRMLNLDRDELDSFLKESKEYEVGFLAKSFFQKVLETRKVDQSTTLMDFENEYRTLESNWNDDDILNLGPGKDLLHKIRKWCNDEYDISIEMSDLIDNMEEVDPEIKDFVNQINQIRTTYLPQRSIIQEQISIRLILQYIRVLHLNPNGHFKLSFDKECIYILNATIDIQSEYNMDLISVLDGQTGELKEVISHDKNYSFSDIFVDSEHNLLYLSGDVREEINDSEYDLLKDTFFVINKSKEITTKSLLTDIDDGKEGELRTLIYNHSNDLAYVSSIYFEGGNPALYAINVKSQELIKDIEFDEPGPMDFILDKTGERIIVVANLNSEYKICISIINAESNTIVKRIVVPHKETITPLEGHVLSLSNHQDMIYLILSEQLHIIHLHDSTVDQVNLNRKILKIQYSNSDGRTYIISFTENDKKYHISLFEDSKRLTDLFTTDEELKDLWLNHYRNELYVTSFDSLNNKTNLRVFRY